MIEFIRARLIAGRAVGAGHPNALLALVTAVGFAIVLGWSWSTPSDAQCVVGGANYCQNGGAPNPCAMANGCQPTGPGYTCTYNNEEKDEGYYVINPTTTWSRCFTPATTTTMDCSERFYICGTTKHFLSGYTLCPPNTQCVASWYWEACYGSGTIC